DGKILHGGKAEQVPAAAAAVVFVGVPRIAAEPRDDARVLDGIVRVIEHRAAGRDAGLAGFGDKLAQPAAANDLDIIVQQQQKFAVREFAAKVVDAAEVESPGVADDAAVFVAFGQIGRAHV